MARTATLAIVTVIAGVALGAFGFRVLDDRSAPPIVIEDPVAEATIVVAIEGAVATPGVFALGPEARMQDALARAGGLAPDADLAAINPAQRLQDEQRIVVPRRAPTAEPSPSAAPSTTSVEPEATAAPAPPPATAVTPSPTAPVPTPGAAQAVAAAPIDINRASAAELETLPGIGPALAQRILDHRTANGPFLSVDGLEDVQGISARMVEELRPLVTIGP